MATESTTIGDSIEYESFLSLRIDKTLFDYIEFLMKTISLFRDRNYTIYDLLSKDCLIDDEEKYKLFDKLFDEYDASKVYSRKKKESNSKEFKVEYDNNIAVLKAREMQKKRSIDIVREYFSNDLERILFDDYFLNTISAKKHSKILPAPIKETIVFYYEDGSRLSNHRLEKKSVIHKERVMCYFNNIMYPLTRTQSTEMLTTLPYEKHKIVLETDYEQNVELVSSIPKFKSVDQTLDTVVDNNMLEIFDTHTNIPIQTICQKIIDSKEFKLGIERGLTPQITNNKDNLQKRFINERTKSVILPKLLSKSKHRLIIDQRILLALTNYTMFKKGKSLAGDAYYMDHELVFKDRFFLFEKHELDEIIVKRQAIFRTTFDKCENNKGVSYVFSCEVEYSSNTTYEEKLLLEKELLRRNYIFISRLNTNVQKLDLDNMFSCVSRKVRLYSNFDKNKEYYWAYKWHGRKARFAIIDRVARLWPDAECVRNIDFYWFADLDLSLRESCITPIENDCRRMRDKKKIFLNELIGSIKFKNNDESFNVSATDAGDDTNNGELECYKKKNKNTKSRQKTRCPRLIYSFIPITIDETTLDQGELVKNEYLTSSRKSEKKVKVFDKERNVTFGLRKNRDIYNEYGIKIPVTQPNIEKFLTLNDEYDDYYAQNPEYRKNYNTDSLFFLYYAEINDLELFKKLQKETDKQKRDYILSTFTWVPIRYADFNVLEKTNNQHPHVDLLIAQHKRAFEIAQFLNNKFFQVEMMDDQVILVDIVASVFDGKIFNSEPFLSMQFLRQLSYALHGWVLNLDHQNLIPQRFIESYVNPSEELDPTICDGYIFVNEKYFIKWKIPTFDARYVGGDCFQISVFVDQKNNVHVEKPDNNLPITTKLITFDIRNCWRYDFTFATNFWLKVEFKKAQKKAIAATNSATTSVTETDTFTVKSDDIKFNKSNDINNTAVNNNNNNNNGNINQVVRKKRGRKPKISNTIKPNDQIITNSKLETESIEMKSENLECSVIASCDLLNTSDEENDYFCIAIPQNKVDAKRAKSIINNNCENNANTERDKSKIKHSDNISTSVIQTQIVSNLLGKNDLANSSVASDASGCSEDRLSQIKHFNNYRDDTSTSNDNTISNISRIECINFKERKKFFQFLRSDQGDSTISDGTSSGTSVVRQILGFPEHTIAHAEYSRIRKDLVIDGIYEISAYFKLLRERKDRIAPCTAKEVSAFVTATKALYAERHKKKESIIIEVSL